MREKGRHNRLPASATPAVLAVALFVLGTPPANAQPTPHGGEMQVNSYTTGAQRSAAVATDPSGGFVVVWTSQGSAGTDSVLESIHGQRFDARGLPVGAEWQVNTTTSEEQFGADVALDAQGGFVVTWTSNASGGTDSEAGSIQAQRFDGSGAPLGGEIQVNSATPDDQRLPAVAVDRASGRFLVVWLDELDGSIQGQAFRANGDFEGGQLRIDDDDGIDHYNPAIVSPIAGEFVVAWEAESATGDEGYGIRARRYSALGVALAASFQVNTYTSGNQYAPALGAAGQGAWVATWQSNQSEDADTSAWSVHARRFDGTGPVGAQFEVNTYTSGDQDYPDVAVDEHGHFVIVWESRGSTGSDSSFDSVQARRYDAAGVPLGDPFQVNTTTSSYQFQAVVADDGLGDFLVVWESDASAGGDSSSRSIQAQRYDDVFREDFEAGDWARWSNVMSGQPSS